jgi:hypothetical protein
MGLCKGKTEQQHIKEFNIHNEHLPEVRRAFFCCHLDVLNACELQKGVGISWAVQSL